MSTARTIFGSFVIAIALFFFWPQVVGGWQYVSALRGALAERTTLLAARTAAITKIHASFTDYQQKISSGDGQKLAELVPVSRDGAELYSAIQDIAGRSGVTMSQIGLADKTSTEGQPYKTLSMDLNLSGSYSALRTFLGQLESYVRLLNIQTIQVSSDTQQSGHLTFTIKAEAYFIK